jgi:hypothetical protein
MQIKPFQDGWSIKAASIRIKLFCSAGIALPPASSIHFFPTKKTWLNMTTRDGAGTRNPGSGNNRNVYRSSIAKDRTVGNEKEQGKRLGSAQHQLDDEMTRRPQSVLEDANRIPQKLSSRHLCPASGQ